MDIVDEYMVFGGVQRVYKHTSKFCKCDMKLGVFLPPGFNRKKLMPAVIYLSGLTCTEQNFISKAGAQRSAAELGLVLIAPDTSPRGDDVPDVAERYDLGKGAGFYIDATQEPWAKNYQMESYIRIELLQWIEKNLAVDMGRIGITGHSMGGHGALTLHLKYPDLFKTCSAFSPIVAPTQVPWGQDAFKTYLGGRKSSWTAHDASELVLKSPNLAHILIDQGLADEFFDLQLKPEIFRKACQEAGQKLTMRLQGGYDHSYYFVASHIDDHLRHHARYL